MTGPGLPAPQASPAVRRGADLVAGLSIAGLLLPEAVAYSSIAGLPPQQGIIALFAGLVGYFLAGSSRFAIVSATSSSAAVLAAATADIAPNDPALRLALGAGLVLITALFFLLAALARLGSVTNFIAKPVLRGFAFGLAIVIITKQLASVVGVKPEHADLLRFAYGLLSALPQWNLVGIAIIALSLALLFLFNRWRRVPGGLLVIVLSIVAVRVLDLQQYGVHLVGDIDLQVAWPTWPQLSLAQWLRLGELGLAMVLILYAESYGSIRSLAIKHGENVQPDRDLLALGISNLASGLLRGMPVGAGYSASVANEAAGAVSRWAGGLAALVLLLIVLTLLPSIALTPEPVLAAIVIHALRNALNPASLRPYFLWRRDRLVVIVAIFGVLLLGVLGGLLAAIAMSLVLMLRRFAQSGVSILGRLGEGHDFVSLEQHRQVQQIPGLLILRPDEPLFFANAERILNQSQHLVAAARAPLHTVILSLEESPDLDSSSLEALEDFLTAQEARGLRVLLARLKPAPLMLLGRVMPTRLASATFTDLSVDDAVANAMHALEAAPH